MWFYPILMISWSRSLIASWCFFDTFVHFSSYSAICASSVSSSRSWLSLKCHFSKAVSKLILLSLSINNITSLQWHSVPLEFGSAILTFDSKIVNCLSKWPWNWPKLFLFGAIPTNSGISTFELLRVVHYDVEIKVVLNTKEVDCQFLTKPLSIRTKIFRFQIIVLIA